MGQSALFLAANTHHASLAVVRLLAAAGAGPINEAALWATKFNNADITEWLIDQGAHVPDPNYFMTIASQGWLPVMRTLLLRGRC